MSKEIKAGDSVDFKIAGKTLTMDAVPYKNVKKVFKIVFEAISDISKDTGEAAMMKVPRIMEEKVGAILPLLFWPGKYEFLTDEWIDDNLTINDIRAMIEAAIKVNGLEDFFAKTGGRFLKAAPAESVEESRIKPTV